MTTGPDDRLGPDDLDETDAWSGESSTEAAAADDTAPAVGEESGLPDTGNARVDQAVARLTELQALPTSEHADVYEDVHRRLQTALTDLDSD